jgi:hypothetical protein
MVAAFQEDLDSDDEAVISSKPVLRVNMNDMELSSDEDNKTPVIKQVDDLDSEDERKNSAKNVVISNKNSNLDFSGSGRKSETRSRSSSSEKKKPSPDLGSKMGSSPKVENSPEIDAHLNFDTNADRGKPTDVKRTNHIGASTVNHVDGSDSEGDEDNANHIMVLKDEDITSDEDEDVKAVNAKATLTVNGMISNEEKVSPNAAFVN